MTWGTMKDFAVRAAAVLSFAELFVPVAVEAQVSGVAISSNLDVTLTEGTNIAVALSPDGATLAFDLLGRIWVVPASGGEARALTDPLGDARQPTWSLDGSRIAFQAYWDGNYHIWSVSADGSRLERHTTGASDHREPHFSPLGDRIAFSSDRGGSYDIWTLTVADGAMDRITTDEGSEFGPAFSPSGGTIAYTATGGADAGGIWVADGAQTNPAFRRIATDEGFQANAPAWTTDGRTVIYNLIGDGRSTLRAVGADHVPAETAPADQGDARPQSATRTLTDADEDVFPFRVAATPDGYFYTADGHIRWRDFAGQTRTDVPFRATVTLNREPYERKPRDLVAPGPFPVKGIVSPAISPDGRQVAFSALGDLWIHTIGGDTERITDDPWVETDPAWSPDGSSLAFSSDRDGTLDLYVLRRTDSSVERITQGAGATLASWSPDGTQIAFVGSGYQVGVSVVDLTTGAVRPIRGGLNGAGRPSWSPDGRSVAVSAHWRYSDRFREGVNRALALPVRPPTPAVSAWSGFASVSSGFAQSQLAERFLDLPALSVGSRGTDGPVRSPDGWWTAWVSEGVLWAVQTDREGDATASSARRLSNNPAADPTWTADSRSIAYMSGSRYRRVDIDGGAVEKIPLSLEWRRAQTTGTVLIRAGAVWDGRSDSLRRDVDIMIESGRIIDVRPADPERAADRVIDLTGNVVMPGLIEMHAHGGIGSGEQGGRQWLSWGVTTVRCPACDAWEIAEARESGESGKRIAPRWFGTGGTIDGSRIYYPGASALGGSAQVGLEMGLAEDMDYDLVKTYVRLSDPAQKRVVAEAHALGLPVTSHELYPAVAFGADGVEHVRGTSRRGYSTKVSELNRSYGDVVDLLAASGMTLTPTIGIYGAYRLLVSEDPSLLNDPRVRTFVPWAGDPALGRADLDVAAQLVRDMASLPRRVLAAGGRVVVGTDAPINPAGLSFQAELEAMVRYGPMRPVDVLRSATSASAEALGYRGLLGTIEPGALADLIAIAGDPLADIRAVRNVRMVIAAGRAYEMERLLRRE